MNKIENMNMRTQTAKKANKKYSKINKSISIKIKQMLLEKGISQQQIADDLKVHKSTVSLCINGYGTSERFYDWVYENLGIVV